MKSSSFQITILLVTLMAIPVALWSQEIRVEGNRLFVPVIVNGVSTEALLDSGAEIALLDARFARSLSLTATGTETARGTGGAEQVELVQHVDIHAMGVRLDDRMVAVLDLTDISERLVGEPVKMVLGRDLFDAARFFLDIERGLFRMVDSEEEPAGVRLSLVDHKGIKQLPVSIEGSKEVYADFDLGSGGSLLIGADYAVSHGLTTEDRVVARETGGGIGGSITRDVIALDSLWLAGVSFEGVRAAIDPTEDAPAANVGVSILRNFSMTIDFTRNAIWMTPGSE
jgi:hypothetical protein